MGSRVEAPVGGLADINEGMKSPEAEEFVLNSI